MADHIFHLAIPSHDLLASRRFYVDQLGCRAARSYDDRLTLEFFGHQVVCHLAPDRIDPAPEMYPRHFGITFVRGSDFDTVLRRALDHGCSFFAPPFERFEHQREAHRSFLLRDPSNNLIEFKHYADPAMIY